MKLSSLPLFSEKSLVKGLVFLNLSLLYKGQNDSYNKFKTTKNYAGNDDMTKKEKEIYPRSRKEMLRIIKTAEKEGHLLETALEEFTIHPFSMPALWDCREYIWGIGQENYLKKPLIISLLALLSTMIFHKANEVGMRFSDYLKSPAEYFEELTATEKAVLRLMAQGMSNDEIANKMGKKTGTVKFHSNNIFHKLQVQNRQQAVNRGREINLL